MERIGFVTGSLAEAPLRRLVSQLGNEVGFEAEVFVARISVAALMTASWLKAKIRFENPVNRVIVPGWCTGDLAMLEAELLVPIVRGPKDFRDLPEYFQRPKRPETYGDYNVVILAEINHVNRMSAKQVLLEAQSLVADGADIVDLGCTPGEEWTEITDVVKFLRDAGVRISVDTFNSTEASLATKAGAELVLSVNSTNRKRAVDWGCEVVAIPDAMDESWFETLASTVDYLASQKIPFRLDPILEPIGVGLAASLGRYIETRRRFPQTPILMGVGNVTELTEVDSVGVNALLIGFCQELAIESVLTTQVIHWAKSTVREIDIARRLMKHAVDRGVLPKHLDDRLVVTRAGKPSPITANELEDLKAKIRDRNFRLHVSEGKIHAINRDRHVADSDPFTIFEQLGVEDPSHAFYLGWEMMKATLALQLDKRYVQDEALGWGHLTVEEISHRDRKRQRRPSGSSGDMDAEDADER